MNLPPGLPIGNRPTHKRAISNLIGNREHHIKNSRFRLKESVVLGAWQGTSRSRDKERTSQVYQGEIKDPENIINTNYTESQNSISPLN